MKGISHLPRSPSPQHSDSSENKTGISDKGVVGGLASHYQKRLTSSPFEWWPQPIPVHLLPFMNFNSLYLPVLKSPGRLRVSNQPLQIDWESGSAVFIENSLCPVYLFCNQSLQICDTH